MEIVEIVAALPQRHIKANIPILENGIAAGFPSPALDYMEKDIDLSEYLIKHPQATFIGRAKGDSMKDAFIPDGGLACYRQVYQSYKRQNSCSCSKW